MRPELTPEEQERHRRRDSLPVLPDTYGLMLRLIGEARTVKFVRRFGGTDARFPARPAPDHDMVRLIGRKAVEILRAEYGPIDIHWPAASDYLAMLDARALRLQGFKVREIARRVYRDPKTVERYLRGVRPLRERLPQKHADRPLPVTQLPLFGWRRGE